uniref:Uncharacterized protein n=1 Tax=Siphoviridae sp. ctDIL13 TaxID=2827811 RepID=A0A8S5SXS2_9CAUD|nr:MAG TPA: hypothetical protein [Siphoviridae sp. ctDIL13]
MGLKRGVPMGYPSQKKNSVQRNISLNAISL